jgi:hypothetical protein
MPSTNQNTSETSNPNVGYTKKKALGKKGGSSNKLDELDDGQPPSIVRDNSMYNVGSASTNTRNILTGYYGTRGERIRHTVYYDALQIPKGSWDIIREVTKASGVETAKKYQLPALDGVLRPCIDPHITQITVTNVEIEKVEVVQQSNTDPVVLASLQPGQALPQPTTVKVLQTRVQNRVIRRSPISVTATTKDTTKDTTEAERIRGGGVDGDPNSSGDGTQPIRCSEEATDVQSDPVNDSESMPSGQPQGQLLSAEQNIVASAGAASVLLGNKITNEPSDSAPAVTAIHQPAPNPPQPIADFSSPPSAMGSAASSRVPVNSVETLPMESAYKPVSMETEEGSSLPSASTKAATSALSEPSGESPNPETPIPTSTMDTFSIGMSGSTGTVPPDASFVGATDPGPATSSTFAVPAATVTTPAPDVSISQAVSFSAVPTPSPSMTQIQPPSKGKVIASSSNEQFEDTTRARSSAVPADAVSSGTDGSANVPSEHGVKMERDTKEIATMAVEKKDTPPAQSLLSKPDPEWKQHKPGQHDETLTPADQLPQRPEWYQKDSISDMERSMLPEWFDSSSLHRTPESYLETREKIINMSDTIANRNLTNAMIRRGVVGDAGSLQRLRTFLVNWGIINEDGINDSTPTPAGLRSNLKRPKQFSEDMRGDLIAAVVEQAKRRKVDQDADGDHNMGVESTSSSSYIPIDWDEVANLVGHGTSAEECQQYFLMESFSKEESASTTERPITPDATQESSKPDEEITASSRDASTIEARGAREKELKQMLVERCNPRVLTAMVDAATKATDGNLVESQAAAVVGLFVTRTIEEARSQEVDLAVRLSKLVDARMQKLENRMAMLDDVEAILEAEKVALELERRDLYTARCRHWFGGL